MSNRQEWRMDEVFAEVEAILAAGTQDAGPPGGEFPILHGSEEGPSSPWKMGLSLLTGVSLVSASCLALYVLWLFGLWLLKP